jgi:uncharacterized protein YbjT (DUF2867 family)
MTTRTAVLLGATGLVGGYCLEALLADAAYEAVVTLGRRPLDRTHPKLTHHVVDFDRLAEAASLIEARDVFCCLGTTMKQAGSKEAFRNVDFGYPVEAARMAAANGAEQYLLVSALGASPRSAFFYSRVKGEAEAAICALPFDGVYVLRPSLITGERDEARAGEQISERVLGALSFALRGPLRKYRPVEARTIARALVAIAKRQPGGVHVIPSDQIPVEARGF